jgi:hypothetical protein
MRKILGALAVGTLTITLSAPAAHAAPAANVAQHLQPQRDHRGDGRNRNGDQYDHRPRHCVTGLVGEVLDWLL